MYMGFPDDSDSKESACNAGDSGSVPGLGRSPGEGNGYPLQHSGQKSSMDSIVHRVAKSLTLLKPLTINFLYLPGVFSHLVGSLACLWKAQPSILVLSKPCPWLKA